MSILSIQIITEIMQEGEWYHEDHFLPLTGRVPQEVACRCYLAFARNPTRQAKRKAEDTFDQASRGAVEFVNNRLRDLVYRGILIRIKKGRKGRHIIWHYKLAGGSNGSIQNSNTAQCVDAQPDDTKLQKAVRTRAI